MKMIRSPKPTMKTSLSTAIFLSVLWAFNHHVALAQPATAPILPDPNEAPPPGVLPTPSAELPTEGPTTGRRFGGGGGGGIGVPGQSGAYYSADAKAYGYHAPPVGRPAIIEFSEPDPHSVDTLQEDLNVMSLLFAKKLEDAVGENSPTYRMGIPLLLRSAKRGIESLYIDGFGALFTVNVNFPVVPPPAIKAKENNHTTGSDDWDKARKELYGGGQTEEPMNLYGRGAAPYDAEQVGALKRALLEAMKNAANIRGLKAEEWVVATVFGGESVETGPGMAGGSGGGGGGGGATTGRSRAGGGASNVTPQEAAGLLELISLGAAVSRTGRATVLNVRVRKADAESFAKGKLTFDQFEQKATIAAYLGSATHGSGAFWRTGASPGGYQVAPVAR